MKVKVKNTQPRLVFLPLGSGEDRLKMMPTKVYEVDEDELLRLFEKQPAVMGDMVNKGHLVFRANGKQWSPKGVAAPSLFDSFDDVEAPIGATDDEAAPHEESIAPAQLGGGVPGQGVKDCKANVAASEDIEELLGWLDGEKRKTVIEAIEKRLTELE